MVVSIESYDEGTNSAVISYKSFNSDGSVKSAGTATSVSVSDSGTVDIDGDTVSDLILLDVGGGVKRFSQTNGASFFVFSE
jgi:hypothetical protein